MHIIGVSRVRAMELSENRGLSFKEGKDDSVVETRVRRLKRQNKSLIVGIIGSAGVLVVVIVVLVTTLRQSDCENPTKFPEKGINVREIGLVYASSQYFYQTLSSQTLST